MTEQNTINLDDINLDEIEAGADKTLQVKNRFQQLANDKRTLAQEKEAAEAARKVAEDAKTQLEKERDFFKDFSKLAVQHPAAPEFQDKIFDKVKAGYSTEDAIAAVLHKEGKLGGTQQTNVEQNQNQNSNMQNNMQNIAGGDASVNNIGEGEKPLEQMTTEEKFKALQEADHRGELDALLRGRTVGQ